MTLLREIYPDSKVSQIKLTKQLCTGQVVDDMVFFGQSYAECDTKKNVCYKFAFTFSILKKWSWTILSHSIVDKTFASPIKPFNTKWNYYNKFGIQTQMVQCILWLFMSYGYLWALANRFIHISGVTAVPPAVGPPLLCNRSFWWRFLCCHVAFRIFCGCRGFCHKAESDLCLFLLSLFSHDFILFSIKSTDTSGVCITQYKHCCIITVIHVLYPSTN